MKISPFAGLLPAATDLIDHEQLLRAYHSNRPDPANAGHRVSFGTSGHRGSALDFSFNENHILAMSQALCSYRKKQGINGPLFLGMDTHALSLPAFRTTMEVLAANQLTVMIAPNEGFTPTPVMSHAILTYNRGRRHGLSDGIVITPSHNPPSEGGFKYNPPHGGPAEKEITDWIENQANELLKNGLKGVERMPLERALKAPGTHLHDYVTPYVRDLGNILDLDLIRSSGLKLGVDPLGGAGVHYWQPIADFYKLKLTVLNPQVDPSFRFMTRDWDGQIRMDPSSSYAMQSLIEKSRQYDLSFACDTDHDRHGIVTPDHGLMAANHYLAVSIDYLFRHRPLWPKTLKIGKTLVSSQMIDRVAKALGRELYEVPVGFKWFVEGLSRSELGFVGEESAGSTFLRKDAGCWTTDKDGIVAALLSAEMTAKLGKNPAALYQQLTTQFGSPAYARIEAAASPAQKNRLKALSPEQIRSKELAGEKITQILTHAPANGAANIMAIGGIKVETKNGWFAARPSGTEDIYKIYAESFLGADHLTQLLEEAQKLVNESIG